MANMYPFGLKVFWFVASVLGLINCLVVLLAFSLSVESYWLHALFALGVVILEGASIAGMGWKMDPFAMPQLFCTIQTILFGAGSFILAGVCATLTIATAQSIFGTRTRMRTIEQPLAYRHAYIPTIFVYPAVCTAAYAVTVVKTGAAKPMNDLHCDANDPLWVRLIGYAGLPLLLAIPSFILSSATAIRVWRLYRNQQCSTNNTELTKRSDFVKSNILDMSTGKPHGHVRAVADLPPAHTPPAVPPPQSPTRVAVTSPQLIAEDAYEPPKFHLPHYGRGRRRDLEEPPPIEDPMDVLPDSWPHRTRNPTRGRSNSQMSSTMPTFAPVPNSAVRAQGTITPSLGGALDLPATEIAHPYASTDAKIDVPSRPVSVTASSFGRKLDREFIDFDGDSKYEEYPRSPVLRRLSGGTFDFATAKPEGRYSEELPSSLPAHQANFAPAIWRIVLFQLAFASVTVLAALSTIVDLASGNHKPRHFGTQHVALLLAAWGPFVVFGHLPGVRGRLAAWIRFRQYRP